jgi:hypothetical protein
VDDRDNIRIDEMANCIARPGASPTRQSASVVVVLFVGIGANRKKR